MIKDSVENGCTFTATYSDSITVQWVGMVAQPVFADARHLLGHLLVPLPELPVPAV